MRVSGIDFFHVSKLPLRFIPLCDQVSALQCSQRAGFSREVRDADRGSKTPLHPVLLCWDEHSVNVIALIVTNIFDVSPGQWWRNPN